MPSEIDRSFDEGQIRAAAYMRGFEEGKRAALAKIAKQATSLAQQTAPERIYLDIGEEAAMHIPYPRGEEVTWSEDNATGFGVQYVRADLAQAAPAGWKLVPVEPTIAMCIAGDEARITVEDVTRTPAVYRAMLSAAPQAPSGGENDHG